MKSKEKLVAYIDDQSEKLISATDVITEIVNSINEKHNVQKTVIMDLFAGRSSIFDTDDFILFCITEELDEINKTDYLAKYFTKRECKNYKGLKLETEKNIFPIIIKCIQISPDQWIGGTDVNFLMMLRDKQLINYNVNAQRTMKRINRDGEVYYRIALNRSAVTQIKQSYLNNSYIPNTITLNMADDSNAEYYYDTKKGELIIKTIDYFDMSDGYHRYIAMCQLKDINVEFNYPVEIRIITFPEDKVKQFIFQEDQKTKMRKIDSASMDMNSPANLVCERLNRDILFDLKGEVNRNEGIINFAELALLTEKIFIPKNIDNKQKRIMETEVFLRDHFNMLFASDELLAKRKRLTFKEMCIIMNGFKHIQNGNVSEKEGVELILKTLNSQDSLDNKMFRSVQFKKVIFNRIDELMGV